MTTGINANWAMPNYSYGTSTFSLPINSYVSQLPNSAFGYGYAPIGTGLSSETYEQALARQRRQEEAEFQKNKREYEARKAQEEQAKLLEGMQKESSDIFPELTAEEEEIYFKYLEKIKESYNKQFSQEATESVVGIAGAATATGVVSWAGNHIGATRLLSKGATYVGNATPTWMTNTATSIRDGASWVAQNTGASTLNTTMNTAGYGKVATAASDMSARAASATGTISKAVTSCGAKTANFCKGALSKVSKLGPVVEAGKVVYEDWGDLKTAYKAGGKSAVKQTVQTGVKAGVTAVAFWAGCKTGAAIGATIGGCLGPVGAAVGGFLGGLFGGIVSSWGAKKLAQKCVGEDEGERLKRLEMEKEAQEKAAAEQAEKMESYNLMLMDALTYAQTDEELDEATAAVLAKLQGRLDGSGTMTVEEQAVAAVQAQAQEQQQAQA